MLIFQPKNQAKFTLLRSPFSPERWSNTDRWAHSEWRILRRIRMIKPRDGLGLTSKPQKVIAVAADEDQSLANKRGQRLLHRMR